MIFVLKSDHASCVFHSQQYVSGDDTMYSPDDHVEGRDSDLGAEIVSPLISTADGDGDGDEDGGERRAMHPGWGFGYNGPDPRVRFEPQVSDCSLISCARSDLLLLYP